VITENVQLLKQLFSKFLMLYEDIEAVAIINPEAEISHLERRNEDFIKTVQGLTNYLRPRIKPLLKKGSKFSKYGIASLDTTQYRHIFVNLRDKSTILYLVMRRYSSIEKIEPFALFLAEKVSQIFFAESEEIEIVMPSFQYESGMFEKYKTMIGFESGAIYRFKFAIIGDNAVGKTSCVRRFVEDKFDRDYKSTIGLNIVRHSFNLLDNEINVVMWDLGGQVYYHRFRRQYYLGTQAAFIVFDLTRRESFERAGEYWFEELRNFVKQKHLTIVLIGNKSDLKKKRQVSSEEGQQLADELTEKENSLVAYIECSALNGENIEDAFETLAYQYMMLNKEQESKLMQEEIVELFQLILSKRKPLTIAFFSESLFWSPAVRILTGISKLGDFKLTKDEEEKKIYEYDNGLILKEYSTYKEVSDCDGIYVVFDARDEENIDEEWREFIIAIIKTMKENAELIVGIRITKEHNWSQMMAEFNLNEYLEQKMVNISFFELGDDFTIEIHDHLKTMLNSLKFYA
jgi:small GTP-binding protein